MPAVGLSSRDVDLADAAAAGALAERLHPHDVVVFLAALTPDKGRDSGTLMRNLAMARAVCEATRRVQIAQLIYASSDAVYSFATTLISEDTPAAATDLYGAMHRTRELMLASEAKAPLAILRLTAIYGAGDTHNSYGPNRFLRQALGDGRVALFGVSLGCLLASFAFARDGVGQRLLGAIGHADLNLFARSYAPPLTPLCTPIASTVVATRKPHSAITRITPPGMARERHST